MGSGKSLVENKGKVEDIEGIFHKDFTILVPKVEAKVTKAWVHSNFFMMVVHMFQVLKPWVILDFGFCHGLLEIKQRCST